jgi:hypothetical protein
MRIYYLRKIFTVLRFAQLRRCPSGAILAQIGLD